ncbi:carbohydrate-binding module family 13 protein [Laetiporus sulphureus 93-53]|uniref:Carbohydrate-binding module family 13 protein n=1 Tax=Laetiporus sulphureus 93-53 TaxID=1314785 RepID=A0A165F2M6_9APHY|nr:carbohydrate-binding module family 13 protein [Laetiporus sulphureus 93-53]KZT08244.1 carbohydrate-binding module family 13 protein [Laetiporus sulphureus 93-53]
MMLIQTPGTYALLNARSGTALDLSGADRRSVLGYPSHMGENQQWEFLPNGKGYAIRSARMSLLGGLFLTVEGVYDGARIIGSPYPTSWDVHIDEEYRSLCIFWPNTSYFVGLDNENEGSQAKARLMEEIPGKPRQRWFHVFCRTVQGQQIMDLDARPYMNLDKFILRNVKSGTVLDLSGADRRSILGWTVHRGHNQQWEFLPYGRGYAIRAVWRPTADPLYLSVENTNQEPQVVASPFPTSWELHVDQRTETVHIQWSGTSYAIELGDQGSATPGTRAQLMIGKAEEFSQSWQFMHYRV